jgi:hypothetical protein
MMTLKSLGLDPVVEHTLDEYSIDLAITAQRIAIEVGSWCWREHMAGGNFKFLLERDSAIRVNFVLGLCSDFCLSQQLLMH